MKITPGCRLFRKIFEVDIVYQLLYFPVSMNKFVFIYSALNSQYFQYLDVSDDVENEVFWVVCDKAVDELHWFYYGAGDYFFPNDMKLVTFFYYIFISFSVCLLVK